MSFSNSGIQIKTLEELYDPGRMTTTPISELLSRQAKERFYAQQARLQEVALQAEQARRLQAMPTPGMMSSIGALGAQLYHDTEGHPYIRGVDSSIPASDQTVTTTGTLATPPGPDTPIEIPEVIRRFVEMSQGRSPTLLTALEEKKPEPVVPVSIPLETSRNIEV